MKKFECRGCKNHCVVTTNDDCCPVLCHLVYEDWHEVKEAVTDSNQLPKLTAEVFDRPDCPDWANYAVINSKGRLSFFGDKPNFEGEDYGCWSCDNYKYTHINNAFFDPSDWQNSLIKRPTETLPDWCKVKKHGFDNEQERYFEITNVDEKWVDIKYLDDDIGATCDYSDIQKCSEAKKRKFNDKEMKALVGRIFTNGDGDVSIATDFDNYLKMLYIYNEAFTNKQLADSAWLLDGKPCYVLEHKNDKGEWVE